jgi:hypothetical protein
LGVLSTPTHSSFVQETRKAGPLLLCIICSRQCILVPNSTNECVYAIVNAEILTKEVYEFNT